MLKRILSFGLLALSLSVGIATAQENTGEAMQDGVSLAIYNQGTALVQDRRTFSFQQGVNTLNFTDVAAGIDATSVTFVSLTDPTGTVVLEQNYVFDLVNSGALLERYLDQTIEIVAEDGTQYRGQLLSGRNGEIILRTDGGQVVVIGLDKVRDLRFPELPGGLITRPTLRWMVQSALGGEQQIKLTYLTGGLNWTADYNLLLANDERSLDLNGWVTLTNQSGAAYRDAQVKLIAGDVNRLPEPELMARMADGIAYAAASPEEQVAQRDFSQYKLYEITRPVTIGMNETKQVEFVAGADIPATTIFVYEPSQGYYNYGSPLIDQYYGQTGVRDVGFYLEFSTGAEGGLDAALPAGRIRVYQEDTDGAALLIGENAIDHTAKGEDVRIYLGNAFDLVGERVQTSYSLIASNVLEETYEIRLRNRKEDQAVEIRVPEHLFRWTNWQIVASSMAYTQTDSSTIEFRPTVQPGQETIITYTVRYTFPN
ncbi:MAG: DUF4139 domain-containing protein [Anaerolineae bacterium]|nr:DUF4139 domain-containing protein [Anaerolineae bacterium]NUQ04804.1 DUF4139 domain-containing protein [Anaerolineae bacterium]